MNISNNIFFNNSAEVVSGALLIESSTIPMNKYSVSMTNFSSNTASSVSALDVWSGNITISDCFLFNNSCSYSYGSLRVSSKSPEKAVIGNSVFIGNKSPKKGAALSVYWFSSNAEIKNSVFKKNLKHSVSVTNNKAKCKITECLFDSIQSEAIFVASKSTKLTIDSKTIFNL